MPTNREAYFALLKTNNKYLNKSVIVNLLCAANDIDDHMILYSNFDKEVKSYDLLFDLAERVKNGEPIQYVLGYSFFLGHKLKVNKDVLIPRQETEQLVVDTIVYIKKNFKEDEHIDIADVCTGSGAIAVALANQFKNAKVYATDISKEALDVAKNNGNGLNIEFSLGNMVDPLIEKNIKLDVLVCNPPYIEHEERIDEQVYKYEPHLALLAKPATKFYKEVLQNVEKIMKEHFFIAFEIEDDMEQELLGLIGDYLPECAYRFHKDLYNKMRFLYIIK